MAASSLGTACRAGAAGRWACGPTKAEPLPKHKAAMLTRSMILGTRKRWIVCVDSLELPSLTQIAIIDAKQLETMLSETADRAMMGKRQLAAEKTAQLAA